MHSVKSAGKVRLRSARKSRRLHQTFEKLENRQFLAAHIVGDATSYATIQAAVNAALAGSIINVDAGTYNEYVAINKPLTLRGAQAGIDARTNARVNNAVAETILTGAVQTDGSKSAAFRIDANDVTIDGFTVQGTTSTNVGIGAGIVIGPLRFGTHILNNILQNNTSGLFLANSSTSDPAVIQHNLFRNNNNNGANGGRGIYTNGETSGGNLTNVLIDANTFINNRGGSGTTTFESAISLESRTLNSQSNVRITNNTFDANGKSILVYNADNIWIEGNLSTFVRDQWSAAFRFEGGTTNVTIINNSVFNNTGPAIRIDAKGFGADNSGFVINNNNFYGNSTVYSNKQSVIFGSDGSYVGAADVRFNWWGVAAGPGGVQASAGDVLVTSGNNVSWSPWATSPPVVLKAPYYTLPQSDGYVIQAEDFDHGGEGVGYHDTTTGNSGGKWRPNERVDIETCTDTGGGFDLTNVVAGEWLTYTVNALQGGTYNFDFRVATSQATGGTFHLVIDGVAVAGNITVTNSGGSQIFKTITKTGVTLGAGLHDVQLVMDTNGTNGTVGSFNWMKLTNTTPPAVPLAPSDLYVTAPPGFANISLAWNDNSLDETGFIVERKTGLNGAWQAVTTVGQNVLAYNDTTVDEGTYYSYRVRATNAGVNSLESNVAAVSTPVVQPITYLSDIPFYSAPINGWGPVELNQSNGGNQLNDGHAMSIGGVSFAKGLGVHAASDITYNLNGLFQGFIADVGIDDWQTIGGSANFLVYADGVLIHDTGKLTYADAARNIALDLTGVNLLRLVVTNGGDDNDFDWADWGGARVTTNPSTLSAPTNLFASVSAPTQVLLNWSDTSSSETGFKVERSANGAAYTQIAQLGANIVSYYDTTASPNTNYSYRVRATSPLVDSAYSNVASVTTPVVPVTTYLSDIKWETALNGWGPVEKDQNNGSDSANDGTALKLNGVTYAKGLGTHAPSEVVYNLNGAYGSFIADVGVDDKQTTSGSVIFQVFADNVKIYDSGIMGSASPTQSVNVSVAGVQQLKLVVTDGGDDNTFDWADWAGAQVTSSTPTLAAPTNLVASSPVPTQMLLTWTDNSNGQASYKIERSADGITFAPLANVGGGVTSYYDTTVVANQTYHYRVRGTTGFIDSDYSNVATKTAPVAPPITYVSDMQWQSMLNGFGPLERDLNNGFEAQNDGQAIKLNNVTYAKGLGGHASSEAVFNLNGSYGSFVSDVGVDDRQQFNGTVTFQVWVDGVMLFDSGVMTFNSPTQTATVNVTGAQQLRLVVTDGGDGNDYDWADWGSARLLPPSGQVVNPPNAPSLLGATAGTNTIALAWTDNSTDEDGFTIQRSTDNINFSPLPGNVAANVTTYTDTTAVKGTTYYYRVVAFNTGGPSSPSNTSSATIADAPNAPTLLNAVVAGPNINLTWTDNSNDETLFNIERSTDGINFTQHGTSPANTPSFVDNTAAPGVTYYYRVNAAKATVPSAYTNTASGTVAAAPTAPSLLTATPATGRINLAWTDNSNNETGFLIERSTNGTTFAQIGTSAANTPSYADTTAANNILYYYRVRATNGGVNSGYSNTASTTIVTAPTAPSGLASSIVGVTIKLTWTDNSSNETSFLVERSTNGTTFAQIGTSAANTPTYTDSTVETGIKYYYRVRATNSGGNSGYTATVNNTVQPLVSPWTQADIGTVGLAGSASQNGTAFTVRGAGSDIAGTSDSFHLVSQTKSSTSFTLSGRVASMTNTDANAKAGLMIRNTTAANSAFVGVFVTPSGGVQFIRRLTAGGAVTTTTVTGVTAPVYLRLVRSGSTFTAYRSTNGTTWTSIGSATVTMNTSVSIGMAVTAKKTTALCTAAFDTVSVV